MRNAVIHEVKSWPEHFSATMFGQKSFDLRRNDRDYKVGDYLIFKEYDPGTMQYTGRVLTRQVNYILQGVFGLPEDMVILGLLMV